MKLTKIIASTLAIAAVAGAAFAPVAANANRLQKHKNTWRNIAIGAAALGVIGLANHNSTEAIAGGLGAAYAGSRYERDRHIQSERSSWRRHYYRHHYYHRY